MTPAPWFGRKAKAARKTARQSVDALPDGLWTKCPTCGEILFNKELQKNLRVCNKCGFHYKLSAAERLDMLVDDGTFEEMDANLTTVNVLEIPEYDEKMAKWRANTGLDDAIITGTCEIDGRKVVIGVLDFNFWAGTMGGVVGERVVRAMEYAIEAKLPVIMLIASGGIRVTEGLPGLMQMAKTAAACAKLHRAGVPYIVVLTDNSLAGVLGSYGSLGDFTISEPGLLMGLTADRVAKQAQVVNVPDNFRRAEFAMEHGQVDRIVSRRELKSMLVKLLVFCCGKEEEDAA
jgi:acetyl-CoA carboxylase carboxyl transferase subunit beta